MYNNKKVIYPDQLMLYMNIEEEIFPIIDSDIAITTLSQQVNSMHILSIYQLLFNHKNNYYEVVQELAAFTFQKRDELTAFLSELPQLNGIEMLLLLNPLFQEPQMIS